MATQLLMPTAPAAPSQGFRNYHSTNQLFQQQQQQQQQQPGAADLYNNNLHNNLNNYTLNNNFNYNVNYTHKPNVTLNTQNQYRPSHNRSMSSSSSSNYNYYHAQQAGMPLQHPSLLMTPTTSASDLASAATTANSSRRASTTSASTHPSPLVNTLGFAPSPTSAGAQSPTSPRSYHTRQVRPMYIPAVLRPNEFASKPASWYTKESRKDVEEPRIADSRRASIMSLAGLSSLGQKLTRRSTDDSIEPVVGELDLELFPKVMGQPTRKHWKPDGASIACDEPTCLRTFSYLSRRHHCRKCGNIFCDSHSGLTVPLDEDAKFNPRGTPSRACAHCHREYRSWRSRNNSLSSSVTSVDGMTATPASVSMPPTPTTATGMAMPTAPLGVSPSSSSGDSTDSVLAAGPRGSVQQLPIVASVPRHWNWSTF